MHIILHWVNGHRVFFKVQTHSRHNFSVCGKTNAARRVRRLRRRAGDWRARAPPHVIKPSLFKSGGANGFLKMEPEPYLLDRVPFPVSLGFFIRRLLELGTVTLFIFRSVIYLSRLVQLRLFAFDLFVLYKTVIYSKF